MIDIFQNELLTKSWEVLCQIPTRHTSQFTFILLFLLLLISLYMILYYKNMEKAGILQTDDEQYYFIIITILSIFITIGIVAVSHNWYPYSSKPLCAFVDLIRRLITVFFSTVATLYAFHVLRFRKGHMWMFPVFVVLALAFSPLATDYISMKIEECDRLTFEEGYKGAVYIWNVGENSEGQSENIRVLFYKVGEHWDFPYPVNFFLEFNTSTYPECQIYSIRRTDETFPNISYYNNNSGVHISWRDEDLKYRNRQFVVCWIDFIINWNGTNNEIAIPEKYEVIVKYDIERDVCVGILYQNPDKKGQNFYNWYEQIYDYEKEG